jgi:hypothetical protein
MSAAVLSIRAALDNHHHYRSVGRMQIFDCAPSRPVRAGCARRRARVWLLDDCRRRCCCCCYGAASGSLFADDGWPACSVGPLRGAFVGHRRRPQVELTSRADLDELATRAPDAEQIRSIAWRRRSISTRAPLARAARPRFQAGGARCPWRDGVAGWLAHVSAADCMRAACPAGSSSRAATRSRVTVMIIIIADW